MNGIGNLSFSKSIVAENFLLKHYMIVESCESNWKWWRWILCYCFYITMISMVNYSEIHDFNEIYSYFMSFWKRLMVLYFGFRGYRFVWISYLFAIIRNVCIIRWNIHRIKPLVWVWTFLNENRRFANKTKTLVEELQF